MISYVNAYRDQFGVESICRTLAATAGGFITARGYRAAQTRPRSHRSIRDDALGQEVTRIHRENYSVYGVRKMHAAMRRAGWDVGRDQVGRLMKINGISGVRRGRRVFTTVPDPAATRPADLVERDFTASGPNRLWVSDMTYVPTWSGMGYVAFITDVFSRRIVGWSVRSTMNTEALPLEALNMASWQAGDQVTGVIHHSDKGSQYVSIRYTDRLGDLGITPSVGTVGDSYDNALAETINGLYKTELIKARRPWRTVEEVEIATLDWVWWYNNTRLHSELGYRTPIEFEADHTTAEQHRETSTGALAKT